MSAWQERLRRDREEILREIQCSAVRKISNGGRRKGFFDEIINNATGEECFELEDAVMAKSFVAALYKARARLNRKDVGAKQTGAIVKIVLFSDEEETPKP